MKTTFLQNLILASAVLGIANSQARAEQAQEEQLRDEKRFLRPIETVKPSSSVVNKNQKLR